VGSQRLTAKLRGISPQANYTDRAIAACRRSQCQLLRVEGAAWPAQRIPMALNLGFLDRSRYFFIQVAPQLSSWGWVDPVPDHLLLRKSGRVGNRTRDIWICRQKLWPLDHRGGLVLPTTFLFYLKQRVWGAETGGTNSFSCEQAIYLKIDTVHLLKLRFK
jgi:hypothetical protein